MSGVEGADATGSVRQETGPAPDTAAIASAVVAGLIDRFNAWLVDVAGGTEAPFASDELVVFFSKRANDLVNKWLQNSRLVVLSPLSPNKTGVIVIPRERIEHVYISRSNKDKLGNAEILEILVQLFAMGSPKFATNPSPGRAHQLVMFDAGYTSKSQSVAGESPCAILQFHAHPFSHFRLETAYWVRPAKLRALTDTALKK